MYIREILLKEEEKHRLGDIGLVDDWEKVVGMTEKAFLPPGDSFAGDKECLLTVFYSSVLDYESFIRRERASCERLKMHHFRKTKAFVAALGRGKRAALDEELKTPRGLSVGWHCSLLLFEKLYGSFCRCTEPPERPSDADGFFFSKAGEMFPLDMRQLTERLESDDASFWELCARYMQGLARTAAASVLQRGGGGFADIIKDQTWTDVYRLMRSRLVERAGRVPVFGSGSDFRNFLIRASRLTAAALQRRYARKDTVCMEDLAAEASPDGADGEEGLTEPPENRIGEMPGEAVCVADIHADNPYEVAMAVALVLMDTEHPLYAALTEGIGEKVAILVDKAVNGMSYREIVAEKYEGESPGGEALQKAVVRARKDFERVRKTLCGRMKAMIEKKAPHGVTNGALPA
jgi:hypothetical protein